MFSDNTYLRSAFGAPSAPWFGAEPSGSHRALQKQAVLIKLKHLTSIIHRGSVTLCCHDSVCCTKALSNAKGLIIAHHKPQISTQQKIPPGLGALCWLSHFCVIGKLELSYKHASEQVEKQENQPLRRGDLLWGRSAPFLK